MADNIRRPARVRLWKRIATITASVSTLALIVFVVISFLPHGNDAFSIRIDNPTQRSEDGEDEFHFHMTKTSEEGAKDEGTYIRGESLSTMVPTTAKEVEKYLEEKKQASELNGQTNYISKQDGTPDRGYALIYTIYLVNDSATKAQALKFSVHLDSYVEAEDHDYPLLDYFRILTQREVVGSEMVDNVYYGRKHTNKNAPYPNDLEDEAEQDREPISTYKREWDTQIISSTFGSNGNNGYCLNFYDDQTGATPLVNAQEIVIPAGKTLRFTYAAFFEGNDMDCIGQIPSNSYLLLSLHFGV